MNKYFCSAPFRNLEIRGEGRCTVCCKLDNTHVQDENGEEYHIQDTDITTVWNSKWMNEFRQRFINEEKRPECRRCWDDEANGTISLREQINFMVDLEKPVIKELVLKFSNKCNCACRICDWYLSSLWESELSKTGRLDTELHKPWFKGNTIDKINDSNWDDWKKHVSKVDQICLYGGEPLINDEALKVIDYLVESGSSKNISLVLNTNGTVTNKRIFEKINQFKYADLHFSIDDIDSRYNYERWPSKSESIMQELKEIHDSEDYNNINFIFYTTISAFNVLHLEDILKRFSEYPKWKINFENMAYIPKEVNLSNMPEDVKPKIEEYLNSFDWTNYNWQRKGHDYKTPIINWLYLERNNRTKDEYIDMWDRKFTFDDKRRNQQWRETFPKLLSLLQS